MVNLKDLMKKYGLKHLTDEEKMESAGKEITKRIIKSEPDRTIPRFSGGFSTMSDPANVYFSDSTLDSSTCKLGGMFILGKDENYFSSLSTVPYPTLLAKDFENMLNKDYKNVEQLGCCVIPGCHKSCKLRNDYGDFLCDSHYATFKERESYDKCKDGK
jgi:hypothetical protein